MQRMIFTLLYDHAQFMLSRNFRLQAVGDINWLFTNYDLARVSHGLDEMMVVDVSRGPKDHELFASHVERIASRCFIPITVGGGIQSFETAQLYLRHGADKLLINSAFANDPGLCRRLAAHFGRQCIVAGIDYRQTPDGARTVFVDSGSRSTETAVATWAWQTQQDGAGELLLQSIHQDGTGMGPDLSILDTLKPVPDVPVILMGGVGKGDHIITALKDRRVDAIATANLFNFIGASFLDVRRGVEESGVEVARWDESAYAVLHGRFTTHAAVN